MQWFHTSNSEVFHLNRCHSKRYIRYQQYSCTHPMCQCYLGLVEGYFLYKKCACTLCQEIIGWPVESQVMSRCMPGYEANANWAILRVVLKYCKPLHGSQVAQQVKALSSCAPRHVHARSLFDTLEVHKALLCILPLRVLVCQPDTLEYV